jgi:hypothetical protein
MSDLAFWLLLYGGASVLGIVIAEIDIRRIRKKIDAGKD